MKAYSDELTKAKVDITWTVEQVEAFLASRLQAKDQVGPDGGVFVHCKSTYRVDLKKLAKLAGIEGRIYPHLLRHSLATALLDGGQFTIREVQEYLGHASLNTTQIYTHVKAEVLVQKALKGHPGAKDLKDKPQP